MERDACPLGVTESVVFYAETEIYLSNGERLIFDIPLLHVIAKNFLSLNS